MLESGRVGAADERGNDLPWVAGSTSELLSATHIFSVRVAKAEATRWTRGEDGLEHRKVAAAVELVSVLKGRLSVAPGERFDVELAQRRESEYVVSDFHGLWSHTTVDTGAAWLVLAHGPESGPVSPAALMAESAVERIAPFELEADARLATEGEGIRRRILDARDSGAPSPPPDPEGRVARELVEFAYSRRAEVRDLFGRWLWARVSSAFSDSKTRPLEGLLKLVAAPDATELLRRQLLADVAAATFDLDTEPPLTVEVVRVLFQILGQSSSARLHGEIVDRALYKLIIRGGAPFKAARDVFPSREARDAARASLGGVKSGRSRELAAWLDSGGE
jgi:hypothetical protein